MKLSVVILNWNATRDTERCMRQVKSWGSTQRLPPPALWVVDNASGEPGIDDLEREHPDVKFLRSEHNLGFAGGNNLGIAAALKDGSDAVLLVNNDASVDEASVASMLSSLSSDPKIGVVGPVLWDNGQLLTAGGRDIALHAATHLRPQTLSGELADVDYVPGTVVLIDRRVFEEVGLLDEDYFFGGELADLCIRARRQGFRCVTDLRARASHDLERSSRLRATLHVYYVFRNRFLYTRKHHRKRLIRLTVAWTLRGLVAFALAAVRGQLRRARAIGLGLFDGLRGRFGGQNERVLE